MASILQIFIRLNTASKKLGQRNSQTLSSPALANARRTLNRGLSKNVRTKIECYGVPPKPQAKKTLTGIDVFIDNPSDICEKISRILLGFKGKLKLQTLVSRGLKVWPDCQIDTPWTGHCCCRFLPEKDKAEMITHQDLIFLLQQFNDYGFDVIKTENLYLFDGKTRFFAGAGRITKKNPASTDAGFEPKIMQQDLTATAMKHSIIS